MNVLSCRDFGGLLTAS